MYMFLSDRKRRFYLSLALPQNLSPKKLSFKDKGFLKRNIRNSLEPLSYPLVKQQKILYEKHIYFPLKQHSLYPFYQKGTHFGTEKGLQNNSNFFTQISLCLWPSSSLFINTFKKPSGYMCISPRDIDTGFFPEKKFIPSVSLEERVANPLIETFYKYKKRGDLINFANQRVCSKKNENICIDFLKNYRKVYSFLPERSYDSDLRVYGQTIKTRNIEFAKGEKQRYNFEKISYIKNCLLNPSFSLYFCQKFVSPPIFTNGRNKYLYCRFLFNKEHIKNINPQITKQPQKKNKGFVKLLYERKKILLFYGSIAKKDLRILCRKAKNIPGLFEESIHILLESRVDVLVHRAGFSKSTAMARQLIRQGIVYVNGKKLCSCKIGGKPGDIYTIGFQSRSPYEILQSNYKYTTSLLYKIYLEKSFKNFAVSKKKVIYLLATYGLNGLPQKAVHFGADQKSPLHYSNAKGFFGNLYPGLFLYKNLCKKEIPTNKGLAKASLFPNKASILQMSRKQQVYKIAPLDLEVYRQNLYKNRKSSRFLVYMQEIFLNVYIASLLKSKMPVGKVYKATVQKEYVFLPCIKNIQNANCALYWGQKPLHLEISHKTTSFIYLYKPQKLISPICIDFKCFKFLK